MSSHVGRRADIKAVKVHGQRCVGIMAEDIDIAIESFTEPALPLRRDTRRQGGALWKPVSLLPHPGSRKNFHRAGPTARAADCPVGSHGKKPRRTAEVASDNAMRRTAPHFVADAGRWAAAPIACDLLMENER
mgnify:FL=1